MIWNWRALLFLTTFSMLLVAAMIANVSDGKLSNQHGAWISQAMR